MKTQFQKGKMKISYRREPYRSSKKKPLTYILQFRGHFLGFAPFFLAQTVPLHTNCLFFKFESIYLDWQFSNYSNFCPYLSHTMKKKLIL